MVGAGSAAAIEDDLLVLGEFRHSQGYHMHGQKLGPRENTLSQLGLAADIQKQQLFSVVEPLLQLG